MELITGDQFGHGFCLKFTIQDNESISALTVYADANSTRIEDIRMHKQSDGRCFSIKNFDSYGPEECSTEMASNKRVFEFDEEFPWVGL